MKESTLLSQGRKDWVSSSHTPLKNNSSDSSSPNLTSRGMPGTTTSSVYRPPALRQIWKNQESAPPPPSQPAYPSNFNQTGGMGSSYDRHFPAPDFVSSKVVTKGGGYDVTVIPASERTYQGSNFYDGAQSGNARDSQNHSRNFFSYRSHTGTGWDVRDGRRWIPDKESDVFPHSQQSSAGINFDSYDNIPVEMRGTQANTIRPFDTFQSIEGVPHLLMANVQRVNYFKPTPIQKHSIPTILSGRDLMACAQTGSGKTAAFLFPVMVKMLQDGPPQTPPLRTPMNRQMPYPVCLVLGPTRELAVQIFAEAKKFQFGTGIRTVVLYGGSEVKNQVSDLNRGCDICVATPGRLIDLLSRKKIRLQLTRYLVLDEADRMLDMGFAPQIRSIIDGSDLPSSDGGRQTVMFSATFPREIQDLAREFLHDYIYLAVGRVGSTSEFIRQRLQYADEDQKPKFLLKLLKESPKGLTIIFVETKRKADLIEDFLTGHDFPATSIHGDRTQPEREHALRAFKDGTKPILVATDVAARGLDIRNVTHVINCDLPTNIDDYVHRIGRTGRVGNTGLATSFVNNSNSPVLRDLLGLLEESHQEVPAWFSSLVMSCTSSNSRLGGGKFGGRGRPSAFGSRDIRDGESVRYEYRRGNRTHDSSHNNDRNFGSFAAGGNRHAGNRNAHSAMGLFKEDRKTSSGFEDAW